tara:strand:+ start:1563 stop:1745 length:183 start_codon:yes stop_codon:yes gene_type:complete
VVDADAAGEINITHEYFHLYDQSYKAYNPGNLGKFVIACSVIIGLFGRSLLLSYYATLFR